MTQRRLLIGSLALFVAVAGFIYVGNSARFNPQADGGDPDEDNGSSSSPVSTPVGQPTGMAIGLVQMPGMDPQGVRLRGFNPPANEAPSPPPVILNRIGTLRKNNAAAQDIFNRTFKRAGVEFDWVMFDELASIQPDRPPGTKIALVPIGNKANTFISQPFAVEQTIGGQTIFGDTEWQRFTFLHKTSKARNLKVAYRVSDAGGTLNPNAADWQNITLTKFKADKLIRVNRDLKVKGKYFQFKFVQQGLRQSYVRDIGVLAQPLVTTLPSATPSPTVSPSVSPSPSPTSSITPSPSANAVGTIEVTALELIVPSDRPSPSPSAGVTAIPNPRTGKSPLLPTGSPAPTPTPSIDPDQPNPKCLSDYGSEPLEGASFHIGPANGDPSLAVQQTTDDQGVWQGERPAGNYKLTFAPLQPERLVLVAFCDDNTGRVLFSLTDPTTRIATVRVDPGQETRLIALYGPRTTPHIYIEKFATALPSGNAATAKRVLRLVYLGQRFNYTLNYKNTGGEVAKGVTIYDVIPPELEVDINVLDDEEGGLKLDPDARGGTLVTKEVGDLPAGEGGTITIPVTVKVDAFDTANDFEN